MMKPAKDSLDIGVIVSDIGASLTFYRDILGLQFIGSVPVWFGTMHRLRFGTSDFKLIEPTTVPPRGSRSGESAGIPLRDLRRQGSFPPLRRAREQGDRIHASGNTDTAGIAHRHGQGPGREYRRVRGAELKETICGISDSRTPRIVIADHPHPIIRRELGPGVSQGTGGQAATVTAIACTSVI